MLRRESTDTGASSRITAALVHQFFTPTALFAFAHTSGQAMAKAEPGNTRVCPPLGENPATTSAPQRPDAPYPGASRYLTAHTPAVPRVLCR
ncbi:hypothetical protein F9278_37770 [Streptomyces phaeolivaceus]|uniref:Uncharacterized protein n=1 Tax=Streptomyces phaeolivaceus TaxID=2653200 RepID=A0A5P8KD91_9ACTN|nr:hypothetical protein F9278_37770 [Streptomyces phaeolivaceus]